MKQNAEFFKRLFMLSAVSLLLMANIQAQTEVRGTVTDINGEALIGVTVMVKGTSAGSITDVSGGYRLAVSDDNVTLVFSYVGYQTVEALLAGRSIVDITMEESSEMLDEVVVVGYGTQRRQSITGAVSQISGRELLKAPVGNISSRLGGVLPGVTTLQTTGQPGEDAASILVRGSSAKYIVDGVERRIGDIDPNEIATISVLKDASSAAVYGLDANSVVIITTRRGDVSSSRISFTANYGISANTYMLEMLNGPEYAYWHNIAREMDGDEPVFTSKHVEKMLAGEDGWGNTNWYKETFGTGYNQSYNINARGGTEKIKYFVSLGNFQQKGNVRNFDFERFNLRSNVDATIAQNLELSFNVAGRIEDRHRPAFSAAPDDWHNIPQQAVRAHPYVPKTIDGSPVSTRTASSYVSPLAASDLSGYHDIKTKVVETSAALNYKLPFVKGLSVKFMGAYDMSNQITKRFSTPYYSHVATRPTTSDGEITYTYALDAGKNSASENVALMEALSHSTVLTTNTSLRYENRFGAHSINALALYETVARDGNSFNASGQGFDIILLDELAQAFLDDKKGIGGSSYHRRIAGYLGRINYDYGNKYLVELSMRYDGSYLFAGFEKGKRWTPCPAASAGWRISEEDWFRNASAANFVSNLKLRGSIGLTATTSGIGEYIFLSTMSTISNAVVINGVALKGMNTSAPANTKLTWGKNLQYNGGFDLTMWRGLLGLEFDVFYKYMYDMPTGNVGDYPPSYGGFIPTRINGDKQDHKGFEVSVSHRNTVGDFSYRAVFNGTYTKRRWLRFSDDSPNNPDWLKLTGKDVGSQLGYISLGLFKDEEDVKTSAIMEDKPVRPGDIKYLDRNGDGVISYELDRGYIGKNAHPRFVGGFNFDVSWKGIIDLSFLLQGAIGRDVALTGVYPTWIMDNTFLTKTFYHDGNSPKHLIENSWREDNPGGEYPRLCISQPSTNNGYSSTFWYRNGDYLRLKTAQIGFSFPKNWMESVGIHSARIYAEGQNLLTLSGLAKYYIDPEQPGVSNGYYPQQRIISFGINVTF